MGLLSFVAIDLETTGSEAGQDRIIEISLIRYEAGEEVASLSQLVDPQIPLPLRIQNLTGIVPSMLEGKPLFAEIGPALKAFIGDDPLVAHAAQFDVGFLRVAFGQVGLTLPNRVYDTAEFARVAMPKAKNHRLVTLAEHLGIHLDRHHRAQDDARACGRVFLALLQRVQEMDLGLLRYILAIGDPADWPLAPIFRAAVERKELAQESPGQITQWIKPYPGQLHQGAISAPEADPNPLQPSVIIETLGPGGTVSDAFPSYEDRPQQVQMARGVVKAFSQGSHLLVEAGTGTGKSLAYLVPAFAWAKQNGEKVAISTHTINLQEQLWEKDIPFLQSALQGTDLGDVSAALVKGRPNYICLRKWEEESQGGDFLTSTEERSFHIRLAAWLSETTTGDKAELNLAHEGERQWLNVMSETETCLGPKCKWYRNHCFAYRARRRAADADIMVLNHAMLFADINSGNEILPPFRHLVLDEAHHVEDVATQNLGINLNNFDLNGVYVHLVRSAGMGLLPQLRRRLPKGEQIPARPPVGLPSEDYIQKLSDLVFATRVATDELFRICADLVETRGGSGEESGRSLRLVDTIRTGQLWAALDISRGNAVQRLRNLGQGLAGLTEALGLVEPPLRDIESTLVDIQKQSGILIQYAKAIDGVLGCPAVGDVVWIEVGQRRDQVRVTLRSAPIDVGQVLSKKLFERLRSVVMTSATLSVSGDFEHLKLRLGLTDLPPTRLLEGILSSPFAHNRQALLCIPEDLPNPKSATEAEFTAAVEAFLREYLVKAGGQSLVLFTSHRQLRQVYARLKEYVESAGLVLLGQGLDGARARLVDEFKSTERAVLFGSASFWEGVDIPGDGLSSVILVRLPFSPPGDPVVEARMEDLERRGMSSFGKLSLPQAILKLKQGFGRLIRTRTDRGVVIVLDNRISPRQTRYGTQFLRSLPGPSTYFGSSAKVIERALQWQKLDSERD